MKKMKIRGVLWRAIAMVMMCSYMILCLGGQTQPLAQEAQETPVQEEGKKPAQEKHRKRVIVAPFKGNPSYTQIAQDIMSDVLFNSGQYEIYDREAFHIYVKELGGVTQGLWDEQTAIKAGRVQGVQIAVFGEVISGEIEDGGLFNNDRFRVSMSCKAIDIETTKLLYTAVVEGHQILPWGENTATPSHFRSAIRKAVEVFVRGLVGSALVGRVLRVNLEEKYFLVDLGSTHGVSRNWVFKVEKPGEIIMGEQIWDFVCFAMPIEHGTLEKITKARPGFFKDKKWRWDEKKLADIKPDYRVTVDVEQRR